MPGGSGHVPGSSGRCPAPPASLRPECQAPRLGPRSGGWGGALPGLGRGSPCAQCLASVWLLQVPWCCPRSQRGRGLRVVPGGREKSGPRAACFPVLPSPGRAGPGLPWHGSLGWCPGLWVHQGSRFLAAPPQPPVNPRLAWEPLQAPLGCSQDSQSPPTLPASPGEGERHAHVCPCTQCSLSTASPPSSSPTPAGPPSSAPF